MSQTFHFLRMIGLMIGVAFGAAGCSDDEGPRNVPTDAGTDAPADGGDTASSIVGTATYAGAAQGPSS
jgi:hypothetical protein